MLLSVGLQIKSLDMISVIGTALFKGHTVYNLLQPTETGYRDVHFLGLAFIVASIAGFDAYNSIIVNSRCC